MAKNKSHSNTRAARRAASPSLDVDRSLTSAPRAESPTSQRPSVLANRANAGIQKRQKKQNPSRAQRLRQQKGMERAENIMDQLAIKKAKSINREKTVKSRRGEWEDLNKKASAFAVLQQDDDDEDDDDEDAMTDNVSQPQTKPSAFTSQALDAAQAPAAAEPAPMDDDDQIT